ncbi:MAG: hypothetical protein LBU11_04640 [Zoogloeaceae bacterium]|jgi:hypothetical protein|nr:hypothetical protein [Zoogloeaceae bacterium]
MGVTASLFRYPAEVYDEVKAEGTFYPPDDQIKEECFLDPDAWQTTLDRWIVADDDMTRIPVMLTPFGGMIYYRRLVEGGEDISLLDPGTKAIQVLSWSLTDFFNDFLRDPASVRGMMPMDIADLQTSPGRLEAGEVYQIDPLLLPMQLLKVNRVDAKEMHRKLRDAVDNGSSADKEGEALGNPTLQALLPKKFLAAFTEAQNQEEAKDRGWLRDKISALFGESGSRQTPSVTGLYFSTFVGHHRLLSLMDDCRYRLLFWASDRNEATSCVGIPRLYSGDYRVALSEDRDCKILLDIQLRQDSSGGDTNDEILFIMRTEAETYLLPENSLGDIAEGIKRNGRFPHDTGKFFTRVDLSYTVPEYKSKGMKAPPWQYLPEVLKKQIGEPQKP